MFVNDDETMAKKRRRRTLSVVAGGLFFLYAALAVQFFRLQVFEYDKWIRLARMQHEKVIREPSRRGIFYANGSVQGNHISSPQPLVMDVPKYHIFIDPDILDFSIKPLMQKSLSQILQIPSSETEAFYEHFYKRSRSRRIASWRNSDEQNTIESWWNAFAKKHKIPRNALYFVRDYQRSYPFGKLLGQVLHTIRSDRDPKTNRWLPTGGLEVMFDRVLAGEEGKRILLRSPRHSFDTDRVLTPPRDGLDIYLTINHYLQAIAEEELAKGVQRVNAKGGRAIMMDPHTGEILVMAHYPFFYPERYREYYNNQELVEYTKIKAITDCYEPGSIIKPITVVIALQANEELARRGLPEVFSPKEMVQTDYPYFPGRTRPLRDVRQHHYLNMYMAIQKSSNIYVALLTQKIIETLGAEWYREQLVKIFGFGVKTGVELPYENPGLVPTPGKTYPNGQLEWSQPTPYSLAMGYNILVNSVQMVKAMSILANGGYSVTPTLISKTTRSPVQRLLSKENVDKVIRAMKYTTKVGGSGLLADIPGYTEAGKSATTEKLVGGSYSQHIHFSSFIGFAPADNPAFVLLINIDEPERRYIPGFGTTHYGSKCAAPVFREIAKRSLQYLGIPPDDPFGYHKGDPRTDMTKANWVAEALDLERLYLQWNQD